MIRMSASLVRTLREDPADAEVASHKLLVRAGFIRRSASGVYTWLPLGLKVLRRIEAIVREEMDATGSQELLFSALQPRAPYEATGRWEEYGPQLFRLKDRRGEDYLLAPTHEEMFALTVKDLFSSYKDLPITLYQMQTKYRDEARPRAGLLRVREFVMKDAYSFDISDEGLDASYATQRAAYLRICERLGLEVVVSRADAGAMGGSHSEEFLHPTPVGEDSFVVSPGGYAANVEAVTTVPPTALEPAAIAALPAQHVEDTPGASTISALVDFSNQEFPGQGPISGTGEWTRYEMLKHLVYQVTYPDGTKEPLVIALPGDREVDAKRLEVALAPGVAAPFTEADFARHPVLAKGFIGPRGLGLESESGIRYLVDPRVVEGSSWVAGAGTPGQHVYDLVFGRDFTADGTIEAAEVRDGDPAPDGSGPLTLTRGMEMGHIFQLGRKYAEALGLTVQGEDGKPVTVTMGSYGFGVSRAVAAIAETYHDDKGLVWPRAVAPMDVHVVAAGKDASIFQAADAIAAGLESRGLEVLYDDRPKVSPGVKFKDSELLGIPTTVVIGRSLADGVVEVRDRATGEVLTVSPDAVVEHVVRDIRSA